MAPRGGAAQRIAKQIKKFNAKFMRSRLANASQDVPVAPWSRNRKTASSSSRCDVSRSDHLLVGKAAAVAKTRGVPKPPPCPPPEYLRNDDVAIERPVTLRATSKRKAVDVLPRCGVQTGSSSSKSAVPMPVPCTVLSPKMRWGKKDKIAQTALLRLACSKAAQCAPSSTETETIKKNTDNAKSGQRAPQTPPRAHRPILKTDEMKTLPPTSDVPCATCLGGSGIFPADGEDECIICYTLSELFSMTTNGLTEMQSEFLSELCEHVRTAEHLELLEYGQIAG